MINEQKCLDCFGDPTKESSMTLFTVPKELHIGAIPSRIYCNKALAQPLTQAFKNLIDRKCVTELKTWDGCFNIRRRLHRKSGPYSLHAWGLAVDLNAAWNGYGKTPTLSKSFVECFTDAGFEWGGSWINPDGMHFQLAKLPD